jgi:hypothetical protein
MPTELNLLMRGCEAVTHDEKMYIEMMHDYSVLPEAVVFLNDLLVEADSAQLVSGTS